MWPDEDLDQMSWIRKAAAARKSYCIFFVSLIGLVIYFLYLLGVFNKDIKTVLKQLRNIVFEDISYGHITFHDQFMQETRKM